MKLKLLLPSQVFAEKPDVLRIVAETAAGSFGILPQRLDCVAALVPGILTYQTPEAGEVYVAVDEGILVKVGADVLVSVRNAISGTDLGRLRAAVEQEFLHLDEREQNIRSVLTKLESGFIRRFQEALITPRGRGGFQEALITPRGRGGFQEALITPRGRGGFQEALITPRGRGGF